MLTLLRTGRLHVLGQIAEASNGCLLVDVTPEDAAEEGDRDGDGGADRAAVRAIYKPQRGERPLWDFPTATLAQREVATFVISDAGGWGVVPPTVLRDGPWGIGSVQLWVDHDEAARQIVELLPPGDLGKDQVAVMAAELSHGEQVLVVHRDDEWTRGLGVFDAVVNNADRKGSHLLVDPSGRHFGIDHGICLHSEPKLRTVLWGWAGDPLPENEIARLNALADDLDDLDSELNQRLTPLLTLRELQALRHRVAEMLETGDFPMPPDTGYPAIPWPPL